MICFLFLTIFGSYVSAKYNKPYPDIGLHESTYVCALDTKVNVDTYLSYKDEIPEIWGSSCGRNRGVFATNPPDGHTYSCAKFPPQWGIKNVQQMNDFTSYTPEQGVNALDQFIRAVYGSSIDKDIGACDFESLSEFVCGREDPWRTAPWYDKIKAPIRGVNIGGLFVLERWITPNLVEWGNTTGIIDQHSFSAKCADLDVCEILRNHWYNWYSQKDFDEMKKFELNTIRLPVGYWYFEEISGYTSAPYLMPKESIFSPDHPITKIIRYAKNAGLQVIIDLHAAPGSQNGFDNSGETTPFKEPDLWGEHWLYDSVHMAATLITIEAMTTYINYIEEGHGLDNVMAFEILNEPWQMLDLGKVRDFYYDAIERIRKIRPDMPVILHDSFRPYKWGTMLKNWPFDNVFMDNHAYHAFNIADIASETAEEDRQKQYVHEKIACTFKSQLHFQTCNIAPVLVGEFSIAIDNCMPHLDARFAEYGQCRDIASRLDSPWWIRHIKSFAMRQISTAERELGWAFWTYKLDANVEATEPSSYFWSFRLAAKKGFIDKSFYGRRDACLHAPIADYELGDELPKLTSPYQQKNTSYLRKDTKTQTKLPNIDSSEHDSSSKVNEDTNKNQDNENIFFQDDNDDTPVPPSSPSAHSPSSSVTPIDPSSSNVVNNVSTFNSFSNYALVVAMIFFIGAIGIISHQRLRDVVSSVGGYTSINDPERP